MKPGELTHLIKPRHLPAKPVEIVADGAQREALAKRFEVTAIHELEARIDFEVDGDVVVAKGPMTASIEQPCAITGEDFRYDVREDLSLRFVPAASVREYAPDEEVELDLEDLDEIVFEGEAFDLGEAVAQTLGLAIDPYAEGPNADDARKAGLVSGEEASGPFAALAALKKD